MTTVRDIVVLAVSVTVKCCNEVGHSFSSTTSDAMLALNWQVFHNTCDVTKKAATLWYVLGEVKLRIEAVAYLGFPQRGPRGLRDVSQMLKRFL